MNYLSGYKYNIQYSTNDLLNSKFKIVKLTKKFKTNYRHYHGVIYIYKYIFDK